MKKRKGVHPSRDGSTVGITLRIEVSVLETYDRIAARANMMELRKGGSGGLTAQDVMRHQLQKPLKNTKRGNDGD